MGIRQMRPSKPSLCRGGEKEICVGRAATVYHRPYYDEAGAVRAPLEGSTLNDQGIFLQEVSLCSSSCLSAEYFLLAHLGVEARSV